MKTGEEHLDWAAIVCRQSPMMQLIGSSILIAVLGGAPLLWWLLDAPVWVTGMCGAVAILIIPICVGEAISAIKKSNWLMCIQADGVWLNLRSFRNRKFAPAVTSLHLNWNELESAAAANGLTRISLGSANDTKVSFLELQLAKHVPVDDIGAAILEETKRRTLPSRFAGVESRGRSCHVPIALTEDRRLQIAWRSPMDSITPPLGNVLQELSRELQIEVEEAPEGFVISHTQQQPAKTPHEKNTDISDEVKGLVLQGQTMQAIKLYRQQNSCSLKEAKNAVDQLTNSL